MNLISKLLCASCAAAIFPVSALAQDNASTSAPDEGVFGDIVVTARMRQESLQDVPVVITALDKETLTAFGVNDISKIATLTPSLTIEATGGGTPVGAITLRGISTAVTTSSAEQAINIVVDGVTVNHGLAMRAGLIDVDQVEVLKGPQSLYFGKNASGGVISLRTADPTSDMFVQGRVAHEFNADETIGEIIVSGPITENLGIRVVGNYTTMRGWMRNRAIGPVADRTSPDGKDMFGRLTLRWQPTSSIDSRLKVSYGTHDGNGLALVQKSFCGAIRFEPADDCTVNKYFTTRDPVQGKPRDDYSIFLSTLENTIDVSDQISLTTLTGYSDIHLGLFYNGNAADVGFSAALGESLNVSTFSQEVRLATRLDGPFDMMVGAYFEDGHHEDDLQVLGLGVPGVHAEVDGRTISAFGQATIRPLATVELSGGARYTRDRKSYSGFITLGLPIQGVPPSRVFDKITPEFSASWKPSQDVTVFGAYKVGYKSGNYNIGAVPPVGLLSRSFEGETAKGGEVGIKASLFDRALRLNVAAYNYKYLDLQYSTFDPATLVVFVRNVGSARVKGIEGDFLWKVPGLEGFALRGAVNYNRARFGSFIQDCNAVQVASRTCPLDTDRNGVPESQSLSGRPLARAPNWSGSVGFAFDRDVGGSLHARLNGNATYSGSYESDDRLDPRGRQESYWLYDLSGGIGAANGAWQVDLIGRNLSNKAYVLRSSSPQPGTNFFGGPGDVTGLIGRLRQIMLQLTIRPTAFGN
jgi:iron complex outermembrane receptor protein